MKTRFFMKLCLFSLLVGVSARARAITAIQCGLLHLNACTRI